MPTLVNKEHIEALRAEVQSRKGRTAEITEALNAPEVLGYETGTVTPGDAYEALSAATMLALDTEAGSGAGLAGEAIWFLSALADVEPLSLAEGGRGAETLAALTDGGIIPAAERDALIAAAQVAVLGPSWGQQAGIGRVYVNNVQEVLD
jgi:hypothetical protein